MLLAPVLRILGLPLNSICELGANPVPFTVNVKVVESAVALAGLRVEIDGTGKLIYSSQDAESRIPRSNPAVVSFVLRLKPVFFPSRLLESTLRKTIRESTKDDNFRQLGCSAVLVYRQAGRKYSRIHILLSFSKASALRSTA